MAWHFKKFFLFKWFSITFTRPMPIPNPIHCCSRMHSLVCHWHEPSRQSARQMCPAGCIPPLALGAFLFFSYRDKRRIELCTCGFCCVALPNSFWFPFPILLSGALVNPAASHLWCIISGGALGEGSGAAPHTAHPVTVSTATAAKRRARDSNSGINSGSDTMANTKQRERYRSTLSQHTQRPHSHAHKHQHNIHTTWLIQDKMEK